MQESSQFKSGAPHHREREKEREETENTKTRTFSLWTFNNFDNTKDFPLRPIAVGHPSIRIRGHKRLVGLYCFSAKKFHCGLIPLRCCYNNLYQLFAHVNCVCHTKPDLYFPGDANATTLISNTETGFTLAGLRMHWRFGNIPAGLPAGSRRVDNVPGGLPRTCRKKGCGADLPWQGSPINLSIIFVQLTMLS